MQEGTRPNVQSFTLSWYAFMFSWRLACTGIRISNRSLGDRGRKKLLDLLNVLAFPKGIKEDLAHMIHVWIDRKSSLPPLFGSKLLRNLFGGFWGCVSNNCLRLFFQPLLPHILLSPLAAQAVRRRWLGLWAQAFNWLEKALNGASMLSQDGF